MSAKLLPTTQMGIRAAAATLASLVLTRLVVLERPYWVILTSVLLVTETWGESIHKAAQRLAMTALGCLVGWLLYDLSIPYPVLRPAFLVAGVFLAVYFRTGVPAGSYALMTFFVTVYVVFLFAALGTWSRSLILARVYDTALGCVVALVVSATVLPRRAAQRLREELTAFWRTCLDLFAQACAALLGPETSAPPSSSRPEVLRQLERLHGAHRASTYERLFRGRFRSGEGVPLGQAERLCRYVLAFAAAAEDPAARRVAGLLKGTLLPATERVGAGLSGLAGNSVGDPRRDIDPNLASRLEAQGRSLLETGAASRADLVHFAPLAGYLEGMLAILADAELTD